MRITQIRRDVKFHERLLSVISIASGVRLGGPETLAGASRSCAIMVVGLVTLTCTLLDATLPGVIWACDRLLSRAETM